MIFIQEHDTRENRIVIEVEGQLNQSNLSILKGVCQKHQRSVPAKEISLDLKGLTHIGREARVYLKEIRDTVLLIGLPEFLRMELFPDSSQLKG
ncbi:hypothetical protein KKI24_15120 [bacterium]|nr:hypothetical protein [bacterium]